MATITSEINAALKRIKDQVIQNRLLMLRDVQSKPLRTVAASYGCTHGKEDVLGSKFFDTFEESERAVTNYYRTKRFNLDLYKYLCH